MGRWLTPDLIVRRIDDIDQDALAARGIQALLLDLDNTVCPWHTEEVAPGCMSWIERARQRFRLCLLSNSVRPRRLNRVAERLNIPAVGKWGLGRKPMRGGFWSAVRELGVTPERTAMIGDQLLTDVFGGNRMGMYTVWVLPLQPTEFIGTKPARLVEWFMARRFRRLGMMPEGEEISGWDGRPAAGPSGASKDRSAPEPK